MYHYNYLTSNTLKLTKRTQTREEGGKSESYLEKRLHSISTSFQTPCYNFQCYRYIFWNVLIPLIQNK